jgi:hypothetical protein
VTCGLRWSTVSRKNHGKETMRQRNPQPSNVKQNDLPELIDEKQVSEHFAISLYTLRSWRACGDGPDFYKLGTSKRSPVRYDVTVLAEWLRVHLRVQKARATAEEKHVAL